VLTQLEQRTGCEVLRADLDALGAAVEKRGQQVGGRPAGGRRRIDVENGL
jgi:hypothetical protein